MSETREFIIESPKHGKHTVLIDEEDWERVSQYTWYISKPRSGRTSYVRANVPDPDGGVRYRKDRDCWEKKTTKIALHRFIMNTPKGMAVDHINHNGLDNRKKNLRNCTHAENCRNVRKKPINDSSKFKGVSYAPRSSCNVNDLSKPWIAQIRLDYKTHYIGSFPTPEEAALEYDRKALELHGEFAHLNFPDGPSEEILKNIKKGQDEWAAKHAPASKYRGVAAANSLRNPWTADLGYTDHSLSLEEHGRQRYKAIRLGSFPTQEEAALAYDEAATAHWGDDAILNFPEGVPDDVMNIIEAGRERAKFKSKAFKSKYRGVTQARGSSRRMSQIIRRSDKKKIHIGSFDTQEEAARAYDAKSIEFHGSGAYLNFPEEHNKD